MRALAVIGAGYGDEGKGLFTDALVDRQQRTGVRPWVIRANGGAQAGHTVVCPDGRRHVFHHVGSGAFLNAPTFLSSFFVGHPMLLGRELDDLAALGVNPTLAIDPRAPIALPYDVLLNQAAERARGGGRHGSCGIGFGEAMERHGQAGFAVTAGDLVDRNALRERLDAVRRAHVPTRRRALGLSDDALGPWLDDDAVVERFLDDTDRFLSRVALCDAEALTPEAVVFEGAQGLLLDQDRGAFPHVTRSNTGLKNVLSVARRLGVARVEVLYATRAYRTRHGAGPMAHALTQPPTERVVDTTNVPNAHQGTLRFGWLDADELREAVNADRSDAHGCGVAVDARLAVSCLDQMNASVPVVTGNVLREVPRSDLEPWLARHVGMAPGVESWGPTRATVHGLDGDAYRRGAREEGDGSGFGVASVSDRRSAETTAA